MPGEPQRKSPPKKYGAYRHQGEWRGWVDLYHSNGRAGNIAETPDKYPTKKAAVEAIKGQHPQGKR